MGVLDLAESFGDLRPPGERLAGGPPHHLPAAPPQHGLRRRVHVRHAVPGVQHDHPIAHLLNDRIAGDGREVKQPEAQHAPDDRQAGDAEGGGCHVHAGQGTEAGHVERVGDPGNDGAQHENAGLRPLQALRAQKRAHQERGARKQQGVSVGGVNPEQGAVADVKNRERAVLAHPGLSVEKPMKIARPQRGESRAWHDGKCRKQPARDGMPQARELQRQHEPRGGHDHDAQVLEAGEQQAALQVLGRKLQGLEHSPHRGGEHQDNEGRDDGLLAPPPHVRGQPHAHRRVDKQQGQIEGVVTRHRVSRSPPECPLDIRPQTSDPRQTPPHVPFSPFLLSAVCEAEGPGG